MTIDEHFMDELKGKFASKKGGLVSWEAEKNGIQRVLDALARDLKHRYDMVAPINIGGTAIVVQIKDMNLGVPRALKLPRPLLGKEILLQGIMESEIAHLIECAHPNIVGIFDKGEVVLDDQHWPFYVMEFLDGAMDGQEWLEKGKPSVQEVIHFLQQCVAGLACLHQHNILHCDIKLENMLVMPDGHAKLSDLGSARRLDDTSEEPTVLTFTRLYAHPLLRGMLSNTSFTDPDRVRVSFKRRDLRKSFDLYALGKNLLRLLSHYDPVERELLPPYERRYLELMAYRMLDGEGPITERGLIPPKSVLAEVQYGQADDVDVDLKKLTGEYDLCHVVEEIDHHFPRMIQSSQPHGAPLTDRVANLLSSPYFRRLGGISQLGLIVQVYPTATHSRLEHVLGCYSNVVRYIDALWKDGVNPVFRQLFTEHDINVALVSALCHDIGQYPMAHDMEEADSILFSHRDVGAKILTSSSDNESSALRERLSKDWGVTPEEVEALLDANPNDLKQPVKLRFLHCLIDGPIDADKLDYLIRDSLNLNVPYGRCVDVERLLKCLTVIFEKMGQRTFVTLGIHEKGKFPAEAVAFARYAMFGAVYWHHTARSAKAMLHRAVWEMIPDWDRRGRAYRDLEKAFLEEVCHLGGLPLLRTSSKELPIDEANCRLMSETPQLADSDFEMLCWIHRKSTLQGQRLVEMLCKRELFKRLLVVSHRGNPELWELLIQLRSKATAEGMVSFQRAVQKALVRSISNIEDDERIMTVMQKDRTDEIVGRDAENEVLILVDIPRDRPGSETALYCLTEQRPMSVVAETGKMEEAVLWKSLATQFTPSVGKIRVFCAPDTAETFSACLDRESIEGELKSAARLALQ